MSRAAAGREAVQAYFDAYAVDDRWGELYNPHRPHSHSFLARRRQTVELLGDLRGRRLLDVGCGSGALIELLADQDVSYDGVDASPDMVRWASRRIEELGMASRCRVQAGDAEALPYPAATFDAVAGMGLLEYFAHPQRVLTEVLRVAKPGARLVFTTPKRWSLNEVCVRLTRPARAAARRLTGKPPEIEHRMYTKAAFQRLFTDLGCVVVGEREYNMLILPYPVSRFWPRLAYRAAAWAEGRRAFGWCGTGYIVACLSPRGDA